MLADIRKFFFYQKYRWSPADFANLQTWIYATMAGMGEGAFGSSVLSGLRVLPSSGMQVTVDTGIAVNDSGRLLYLPTQATPTIGSPVGNPARSLIVLRPVETQSDFFPQPTAPSNSVPLYEKQEYELVVLNGTPSATPVYPATQAGDVIVGAFKLNSGHSTIVRGDIDLGMIERPRKKKSKILEVRDDYDVLDTDEIIEANFATTAGVIQLPPAGDVEGLHVSVIKTDPSSNVCTVSGNGAEVISGQNAIELDTQWQAIKLYSTGQAWRIL